MTARPAIELAPESLPAPLGIAADAIFKAADALARDNAEARKTEEKRFDAMLTAYAKDSERYTRRFTFGGRANLVSCVAHTFTKLAEECEEGSEAERDHQFVTEILEAMEPLFNLPFGERSSQKSRKEAMGAALINLGQIKP